MTSMKPGIREACRRQCAVRGWGSDGYAAHLRRCFRAELGLGVKPWIQARRLERARHLLAHSALPVRAIAAQLGIADLQRFNKLVRRACGLGPRALRTRG
jgi:transcriptional regulator GlxA family with amidase domain